MTKKLTEMVKQEIVEKQMEVIRENYKNGYKLNFNSLKEYLTIGLNEYSPSPNSLNEEIDFNFMRNLESELKIKGVARILGAAGLHYFLLKENPKNRHLVNFYEKSIEDFNRHNKKRFSIRNYGLGSHKLLETYLKRKGLLGEE